MWATWANGPVPQAQRLHLALRARPPAEPASPPCRTGYGCAAVSQL